MGWQTWCKQHHFLANWCKLTLNWPPRTQLPNFSCLGVSFPPPSPLSLSLSSLSLSSPFPLPLQIGSHMWCWMGPGKPSSLPHVWLVEEQLWLAPVGGNTSTPLLLRLFIVVVYCGHLPLLQPLAFLSLLLSPSLYFSAGWAWCWWRKTHSG